MHSHYLMILQQRNDSRQFWTETHDNTYRLNNTACAICTAYMFYIHSIYNRTHTTPSMHLGRRSKCDCIPTDTIALVYFFFLVLSKCSAISETTRSLINLHTAMLFVAEMQLHSVGSTEMEWDGARQHQNAPLFRYVSGGNALVQSRSGHQPGPCCIITKEGKQKIIKLRICNVRWSFRIHRRPWNHTSSSSKCIYTYLKNKKKMNEQKKGGRGATTPS